MYRKSCKHYVVQWVFFALADKRSFPRSLSRLPTSGPALQLTFAPESLLGFMILNLYLTAYIMNHLFKNTQWREGDGVKSYYNI